MIYVFIQTLQEKSSAFPLHSFCVFLMCCHLSPKLELYLLFTRPFQASLEAPLSDNCVFDTTRWVYPFGLSPPYSAGTWTSRRLASTDSYFSCTEHPLNSLWSTVMVSLSLSPEVSSSDHLSITFPFHFYTLSLNSVKVEEIDIGPLPRRMASSSTSCFIHTTF